MNLTKWLGAEIQSFIDERDARFAKYDEKERLYRDYMLEPELRDYMNVHLRLTLCYISIRANLRMIRSFCRQMKNEE